MASGEIERRVRIGASSTTERNGRSRLTAWIISTLVFVLTSGLGCPCLAMPQLGETPPVAESAAPVEPAPPRDAAVNRSQISDSTNPHATAGRGLFGLPPLSTLLDDSSPSGSVEFPDAPPDPLRPNIRVPGPDTANFPNSPYTLPQGRAYVELSPLFLSGRSIGTPASYNAEFLLRYGLTDRVELRLFGNGPAFEKGPGAANGFAPLAWDLKFHLWKENADCWIPAVGLEAFVLTPTGSPGLNQGTQPSINLLFDKTLPGKILFEWNVGLVGDPSPNNRFSVIEPVVAWAFQRELFENFDIFFHGYFNGATLPRFGDGVVLGGGALWAVNERWSIFGSYNAGVTPDAPTTIGQFGFAVAF